MPTRPRPGNWAPGLVDPSGSAATVPGLREYCEAMLGDFRVVIERVLTSPVGAADHVIAAEQARLQALTPEQRLFTERPASNSDVGAQPYSIVVAHIELPKRYWAEINGEPRLLVDDEQLSSSLSLLSSDDLAHWRVEEGGQRVTTHHEKDPRFELLRRVRIAEVHAGYARSAVIMGVNTTYPDMAVQITTDLLERALRNEWVGQHSGGAFWGSNLYAQTVAEVIGIDMHDMWPILDLARSRGELCYDGAVLLAYHPERVPSNEDPSVEMARFVGTDGGDVVVYRPRGMRERHEFRVVALDAAGQVQETESVRIMHGSEFGWDVEDTDALDQVLDRMGATDERRVVEPVVEPAIEPAVEPAVEPAPARLVVPRSVLEAATEGVLEAPELGIE